LKFSAVDLLFKIKVKIVVEFLYMPSTFFKGSLAQYLLTKECSVKLNSFCLPTYVSQTCQHSRFWRNFPAIPRGIHEIPLLQMLRIVINRPDNFLTWHLSFKPEFAPPASISNKQDGAQFLLTYIAEHAIDCS
jgi:hypothetical protein